MFSFFCYYYACLNVLNLFINQTLLCVQPAKICISNFITQNWLCWSNWEWLSGESFIYTVQLLFPLFPLLKVLLCTWCACAHRNVECECLTFFFVGVYMLVDELYHRYNSRIRDSFHPKSLSSNRKIRKDISGRLDNKTFKTDKENPKVSFHNPENQSKQGQT